NGWRKISSNHTSYDIGSELKCEAKPNYGFAFSSWSSDFALHNPPKVISTVFDFINYYWFSRLGGGKVLGHLRFGSFDAICRANFSAALCTPPFGVLLATNPSPAASRPENGSAAIMIIAAC